MDPSSEIILETPMFRIYKDLHVDRLVGTDTVPAGFDAATAVASKDVAIGGDAGFSVRLYLPNRTAKQNDGQTKKRIRVLIYFHGGGFVAESAASPTYHGFLNSLAARAGMLVVSVNYRLAPEHPLPVAYEDSLRALEWAVSAGNDPWLSEHGDLGRVFLAGDSAGGNIVHNVAMMAASSADVAARIEGAVLLHAMFWGREPIAGESPEAAEMIDRLWSIVCPEATGGLDDPRLNPMAAAAPSLRDMPCGKLLVCESEGDFFRPRVRAYYEAVVASGWGGEVEWFESMGKDHVFFLSELGCHQAVALMDRLVSFFAGN
ncbi:hypothetical protein HU200_021772 [Digitaria exilis]|uniref:Alpha/beta hydrolase fold-3 domain-containing protein n=1 Tax=Digitaria exilis TaxID=1010633 RepID=A0A835KBH6_9POAL|nr:hypothetical protein HU200_021772 [Digitaria exilis]